MCLKACQEFTMVQCQEFTMVQSWIYNGSMSRIYNGSMSRIYNGSMSVPLRAIMTSSKVIDLKGCWLCGISCFIFRKKKKKVLFLILFLFSPNWCGWLPYADFYLPWASEVVSKAGDSPIIKNVTAVTPQWVAGLWNMPRTFKGCQWRPSAEGHPLFMWNIADQYGPLFSSSSSGSDRVISRSLIRLHEKLRAVEI